MAGQSIRSTKQDLVCMLLDEEAQPKALPLTLLSEITNGFSDELVIGRGGFAVVYKGVLGDHMAVAVKKLTKAYMHEEQFLREVECLMKVRHKNIVRFLGYCVESQGNVQSYNQKTVIAEDVQKILCFEYLPKGTLSDYIEDDESGGLDWRTRYQIIKGMCEGLQYLHETNIVHLDLKPDNVLLDERMIPKITDFGISRCFKDGQTRLDTTKVGGTLGYLAPEFYSNTITKKFDLYSLGVMITEIITGKRGYQDVANVLLNWSNRCDASQLEQIRVCTEIGFECYDLNPGKRPKSMKHIIDRLAVMDSSHVILPVAAQRVLLSVRRPMLCFPFTKRDNVMRSSLHLTNTTDEYVAFLLKKVNSKSKYRYFRPNQGIVPPRTNYSLVVETKYVDVLHLENMGMEDLVLCSTIIQHEQIHTWSFPKEFHHSNSVKHKVSLKAFLTQTTVSSSKGISPGIKDLPLYGGNRYVTSLDITKQWTIVGENSGRVHIWDNRTQERVHSMKVSWKKVTCVKFIARKELLVVGTKDGYIHVYNYETTMKTITSFRAAHWSLKYLAVHPTQPYLLSSHDYCMKLWDWDKGFECINNFEDEHSGKICQVAFNLNGTIIASASEDGLVKIRSLDSPMSNYTLYGHSSRVNSLVFFTCDDKECLVTGSNDKTAKIWDMRAKICIHTLDDFVSPVMCVVYEPNLQILITSSPDGLIYYWNTLHSNRLERIVDTRTYPGDVMCIACSMGRVVIGRRGGSALIVDIDNVNNYNEPELTGDTTWKVTPATSSLELQPLEICIIPCEDGPCAYLHLTNKTDEHVIFSLDIKEGIQFSTLSYGVAPPKSTCTFIILEDSPSRLSEGEEDNNNDYDYDYEYEYEYVVRSSIWCNTCKLLSGTGAELNNFFEEAKYFGNTVHEVSIKGEDTTSAEPVISPRVKITYVESCGDSSQKNRESYVDVYSIDAHPTEPWIITGTTFGDLVRLNYYPPAIPTDTTDGLSYNTEGFHKGVSISVSEDDLIGRVWVVKIIARNQWILAGLSGGVIRVYNSELDAITTFRAPGDDVYRICDMAIHPTEPYLVLSMTEYLFEKNLKTEVWGWDEGGQCTQISAGDDGDMMLINPDDSFVSAARHVIKQVRSPDSAKRPNTLSGHSEKVKCFHYFTRGDREQYLITGSKDCTAKIWDLEKKACIHTMAQEAIMSTVYSALSLLPHRPYLLTGTKLGTVQVWSSTDFRLKRTVNFSLRDGPILGLACFMGSRVVVAQRDAISIMEIDQEVEALASC
uniref:Uncharacterized protein n=1 Tax=Avena sativa TaxID=4498 RepID=A0ACD5XQ11_AVESA